MTCWASWHPMWPNWVAGFNSLKRFMSRLARMMLRTLADVSLRAIPWLLFGSWGSPLPL